MKQKNGKMAKSAQTVEQMFLRLLLFFLSSSFSSALVTLGSTVFFSKSLLFFFVWHHLMPTHADTRKKMEEKWKCWLVTLKKRF